jgi:thioesterase domain-containing protein
MAIQLQSEGAPIGSLIALDSWPDVDPERIDSMIREGLAGMGFSLDPAEDLFNLSQERAEFLFGALNAQAVSLTVDQLRNMFRTALRNAERLNTHTPDVYDGDLTYVIAADAGENVADPEAMWGKYVSGQIESVSVWAEHDQLLLTGAVDQWAVRLEDWLS